MKVLFCISGIGRGHVARCRPLVEALIAGGHDVDAAIPGRRAAALLEDVCPILRAPAGFKRTVAPSGLEDVVHHCIYDLEAALSAYQGDLTASLGAGIAFVDGALRASSPDVVVLDQIVVGAPLTRARGLPVVQVTHAPLVPGHGPWVSWARRHPALRHPSALAALAQALAPLSIPPPATVDEMLRGDAVLVTMHPGFGSCEGALHLRPDDRLGPQAQPPPAAESLRRRGRPLVAVYLGDHHPAVLEDVTRGVVAAGADALLVASTAGPAPDPSVRSLGVVDMDAVMEGCDAAVHHGGCGVMSACLRAGIPSLAVPRHSEQEHNARRLQGLGAGRFIPVAEGDPTPREVRPGFVTVVHERPVRLAERVSAALSELIVSTAVRDRAVQVGREMASLPGAEVGAAAVERAAMERVA